MAITITHQSFTLPSSCLRRTFASSDEGRGWAGRREAGTEDYELFRSQPFFVSAELLVLTSKAFALLTSPTKAAMAGLDGLAAQA